VRYGWILTLVFLLTSPAVAGWESKSFVDRLTGEKTFYAELPAKQGNATLFVGCVNEEVIADIHFPSRISDDQAAVRYSFDNESVVERETNVSPNGTALWLWLISGREIIQKIRRSQRLQMEVEDRLLEFDLTGADEAIAPIHCH
jgi:hypothetical protein